MVIVLYILDFIVPFQLFLMSKDLKKNETLKGACFQSG